MYSVIIVSISLKNTLLKEFVFLFTLRLKVLFGMYLCTFFGVTFEKETYIIRAL